MKIVIDNIEFPYDIGCKILKLRGGDSPFEELNDIWKDIVTPDFSEIGLLQNIEQRRIGLKYYGLEKLLNEVDPNLVDKQTIEKETTWVTKEGKLVTKKFKDTYSLYEVGGGKLKLGDWEKYYFVKCKDTSTDREYMIWVNLDSVGRVNNTGRWNDKKITPVQCIAWTITTNVPEGHIEKIVRQGDCILIKPKGRYKPLESNRHLSESEYRNLLVLES
jgi:hypothetical protein